MDVKQNYMSLDSINESTSKLYYQLKTSLKNLITKRTVNSYRSNTNGTYGPGEDIVIEVSGNDLLDTANSYLLFKLSLNDIENSSFGQFGSPVYKIIEKITIESANGLILEQISADTGLLCHLMEKQTVDKDYLTGPGQCHGHICTQEEIDRIYGVQPTVATSPAAAYAQNTAYPVSRTDDFMDPVGWQKYERSLMKEAAQNAYNGAAGTFSAKKVAAHGAGVLAAANKPVNTFKLPLTFSGLLSGRSSVAYLPMMLLQKFKITINLAPAAKALLQRTDAAGAAQGVAGNQTYLTSDWYYVCPSVEISDDLRRSLMERAMAGQILLPYDSYHTSRLTQAATDTDLIASIKLNKVDCRSIIMVPIPQANFTSLTADSFASKWNQYNYFWCQINGNSYPMKPIEDLNTFYFETRRGWAQINNIKSLGQSLMAYKQNGFHIAIDLESEPSSAFTGMSLSNSSADITVKTSNNALPMTTWVIFVHYYKLLQLLGNGQATIYD